MKINSLQLEEVPSGETFLRCPQCGAIWRSSANSEWTRCACIQFLWGSSELGDADLGFSDKFDRSDFENAYKQQHWLVHQDDEIIDGDLGSPDPGVLKQLEVSGVDEALFYPEIPGPNSLFFSGICVGIKHKKQAVQRKKRMLRKRNAEVDSVPMSSKRAPLWAWGFLGRKFAIDSAEPAGWVDQNSEFAHFGVPSGSGIWLFKLGMGQDAPHCSRGRTWWRFLVIKLSADQKIKRIYTRVDEVFPDGHGEFCTNNLLPHDVSEALEALEAVAPELALITIN
jgi:hypothetical protein